MARTVRDTRLDTRAARLRLKLQHKPYWRTVDQGAHIGYYKGVRGGKWLARYYEGAGKGYAETTLALADDTQDADGRTVLTYSQAQAKARKWFTERARLLDGGAPVPSGPYLVADAMRDYLDWYGQHRKALVATTRAANAHVLPSLGDRDIAKLTTRQIRDWHNHLANAPAGRRVPKSGQRKSPPKPPTGPDEIRRRRATANRVLTVLKAALNHAWREGKVSSDEAWRRVTPFRDVDAPIVRYLTEAEQVRLVNASAPDFRPLVRAALLTGCRYGELVTLKASDFNPDAGTLAIRTSKSGKPRHVVLTDEGRSFFSQSTASLNRQDLVFKRADGKAWGASHQQRPLAAACKGARIKPAISFHVLRHSHASMLAMNGVPLGVIAAQMGHADTRMTERHYAHLSPNYVAETIRASFPVLGIVAKPATRQIRPRSL
jgi:integrase